MLSFARRDRVPVLREAVEFGSAEELPHEVCALIGQITEDAQTVGARFARQRVDAELLEARELGKDFHDVSPVWNEIDFNA